MRPRVAGCVVVTFALMIGPAGCSSQQPENPAAPPPARVVARGSAEQVVRIADLRVSDTLVEGTLVNNSDSQVDDVHLMVNHSFLWKNERKPGRNNPSRTEYYRLAKPVPPHGAVRFEYRPDPPLPRRNDGSFMTTVEVVSFSEIGQARVEP